MRNKSMRQWQDFVAAVREWDRREHNWVEQTKKMGSMPTKNLTTKNDFIHSMMKDYKLERRRRK